MPFFEQYLLRMQPYCCKLTAFTGAGKSTLSKKIMDKYPHFIRLSIDKAIFERRGLYNIDYADEKLAEYQEEAYHHVQSELRRLLSERKQDIILDLSFYNREYRDEFKQIIEGGDGRWVLLSLEADKALLWSRITQRRRQRDALSLDDQRRNGDSALDIDQSTFDMYWENFEKPRGEGEIIITVT